MNSQQPEHRVNASFRTITTHTGHAFCEALRRLIDHYKPDLVWLDPLLSYIGDDISKQSVCSQFLRNWLNPISKATGVIWMILHHTGKPPKDPKSKSHWKIGDFAYEGTGSSELTNWARAVCVLHRLDDGLFELKLAKRGPRAGAATSATIRQRPSTSATPKPVSAGNKPTHLLTQMAQLWRKAEPRLLGSP